MQSGTLQSADEVYSRHVLIFIAFGVGIAARSFIEGNFADMLKLISTSLIIPSVYMAFGVLMRNSRLFETIFIITWYTGPLQKTYPFDFVDFTGMNMDFSVVAIISAVSFSLVLFSCFRRHFACR